LLGPTAPFLLTSSADWSKRPPGIQPGVTIILRTRDRPLFLKRAVKSIAAQSLPDLTVCVVNDGGNRQATEQIVRAEMRAGVEIEFVHNAKPVGQVEALNLGLKYVRREFFAIHDDDDSWSPDFLTEMAGFLRQQESATYTRRAPRAARRAPQRPRPATSLGGDLADMTSHTGIRIPRTHAWPPQTPSVRWIRGDRHLPIDRM